MDHIFFSKGQLHILQRWNCQEDDEDSKCHLSEKCIKQTVLFMDFEPSRNYIFSALDCNNVMWLCVVVCVDPVHCNLEKERQSS